MKVKIMKQAWQLIGVFEFPDPPEACPMCLVHATTHYCTSAKAIVTWEIVK
jgi:hypothetical protein